MLSISALLTQAGSFRLGPLDLTVPADRVLVVLGPSGAGKSILLTTIAGFRTPRSGRLALDGCDITALPAERRRIGMVFQDAALFPHMSVRDNVRFAPSLRGRRHDGQVDELLDRFDIAHLATRAPRSLSGGERQRVALARTLAAQPACLLLDEPLSALDQPVREELREVLRDTLRELGVPAIHVTHDRDEALRIADDLAILAGGTLRQTGPAEDVVGRPADAVTARLLGWAELGPVSADSTGLQVGDLRLITAAGDDATGTVYYRPEEVLIDPAEQPRSTALRVRTQILGVERGIPLVRVRLNT
ncbi:MAG TPA: ABC transporter ATP-binding protein, partial [Mycobacteriales bacterium]|nr:ABC transporter ATP-binding protein [Mycobacteriales bacterium]